MVAIQKHCATGANASSEKRGWKKSTLNFVTGHHRLVEAKKLHLRLQGTTMATVTMLEQPVAFKPAIISTDSPREISTENSNPTSVGFDTKSALEIARIINHEDAKQRDRKAAIRANLASASARKAV